MSTAVWPPLPHDGRVQQEEATLARELQWLLTSLQDTLASLKSGLEECIALLAPTEPGSTLVVSSMRSESVKGFVTRVGTRIVKGDIQLRLQTLPPPRASAAYPLHISALPDAPSLVLSQLSSVRNLLNQSLDVVDISTWTGDAHDANFISGQLRLLFDFIQEAQMTLKGEEGLGKWWEEPVDENTFSPSLPSTLSFHLTITSASLHLHLRTLQLLSPTPATPPPSTFPSLNPFASATSTFSDPLSLRQRFGLAARLQEHDESGQVFMYRGQEVRVREKVRVESQDPSLLALMAKLSALEHAVGTARKALGAVMGVEEG